MVVETLYFAVSDVTGRFVMPDVAPGTYQYHAWRPGGSVLLTGSVVVGMAGSVLKVQWP